MLKSLLIKNYALIKNLEMDPSPGLNVITGETGAGKSIMVGAVGLLLGKRADTKVLLDKDRKCVVEGGFNIEMFSLKSFFENALVATPSAALMLLGRRDGAILAIAPPEVFEPGDLNCDTAVDAFDIEPFILALFDPAGYEAGFPNCDRTLADLNLDGKVDAFDIEPFLNVLFP